MRKIGTLALGAALAVTASILTPQRASAQETPEPDPRNLCAYFVSEGFYPSWGQCMSGFRIKGAGYCQSLDRELLAWAGFGNVGDCVAAMREAEHAERKPR